jgi:hypothetical protein
MKMLTAKVVRGQLDLPEGLLEEGSTVTVLIPEAEEGFDLSEDEVAFIRESMDQIARGDWVDGQTALRHALRVSANAARQIPRAPFTWHHGPPLGTK